VKLVDANLLVYGINEDAPLHERARGWLEGALVGQETVAMTWPVLLAFLRLTTRRAVFPRPLTVEQAIGIVDEWLALPSVVIVHPGQRHWAILREFLTVTGSAGNLTSDAHLAAIAVEHGAELCSTDGDFARFPGLRWRNPISAA
jgi:toxin-antitoxin system PIN domain toxin